MASWWENIFSVTPIDEKNLRNAGLSFARLQLQEGCYHGGFSDGYLVSSIVTGKGIITQHTDEHFNFGPVLPGSVIITPPSNRIEWQVDGDVQLLNAFLEMLYIRQVAASIGFKAEEGHAFKRVFQQRDKLIEGIFSALAEQLEIKHYRDYQYIEAIARALCIHLLYNNSAFPKGPLIYQRVLSYEQMEKIRGYVAQRLEQKILTSELADCVHVSHYHFYRLFKRTSGLTPQQFIKNSRLEKAKILVEHSSLSLSEVAYKTGFTDQSHLSREFRSAYGVAPKKFRDRLLYEQNLELEFDTPKSSLILIFSNLLQDIPLELPNYIPMQLFV